MVHKFNMVDILKFFEELYSKQTGGNWITVYSHNNSNVKTSLDNKLNSADWFLFGRSSIDITHKIINFYKKDIIRIQRTDLKQYIKEVGLSKASESARNDSNFWNYFHIYTDDHKFTLKHVHGSVTFITSSAEIAKKIVDTLNEYFNIALLVELTYITMDMTNNRTTSTQLKNLEIQMTRMMQVSHNNVLTMPLKDVLKWLESYYEKIKPVPSDRITWNYWIAVTVIPLDHMFNIDPFLLIGQGILSIVSYIRDNREKMFKGVGTYKLSGKDTNKVLIDIKYERPLTIITSDKETRNKLLDSEYFKYRF